MEFADLLSFYNNILIIIYLENQELHAENIELRNRNAELEERNRMLEKEVETMNFINEEFAKESEDYRKMNERLMKKIGPQDTNSEGSNSGEGSKHQRI